MRRDRGHKHAQDSSTASNIKYDLVLKEVCVLVDCVLVRVRSDFIFLRSAGRVRTSIRCQNGRGSDDIPTFPRGFLHVREASVSQRFCHSAHSGSDWG